MFRVSLLLLCFCLHEAFAELQDPLNGRSRFLLYTDYVYLKRQPECKSQCISEVESTYSTCSLATSNCTAGSCKITTKDLEHNQGFDSGLRVTADYLRDKQTTFEASYTGLLNWKGSKSACCYNSLEFPFANGANETIDFQNANVMQAHLNSNYWTVEANYWHHVTPQRVDAFSVSWLLGLRYLNFDEYFKLQSYTDYSSSTYKIHTKNRMGGIQLGGDFEGNLGTNFTWGLVAKLCGIVDFAQNTTKFLDDNNTQTVKSYNPSDFFMTFVGGFGPFFLFNLSKHVIFKFSYEMTYVSNIALATYQISFQEEFFTDVETHVNSKGMLLLHGVFVSLGICF